MALQKGHVNAITTFIQVSAAVMVSFFESEEEKDKLLYGLFYSMGSDNKVNFLLALRKGGSAVKKVFTEGVDQLLLSAKQKETLKYLT